ncbi:7,8-didemethyl-8-hydroxy-5-deazariboflavin synthase subunit CofG [filamentous cyanobacterium CCP5]|nr:7,8-didemethyl-8-hydroxy-5-deazariboflavin synthase subunit CofG [filamentous cyanobacterium CCP5]
MSNSVVTYSPAYTLVPTYECFNRCSYCNFRVDPGQDQWLTLKSARQKLTQLQNSGVIEILILSGEVHPHSSRRQVWFEHIYALCELALSMGFLPHTNAGPLSFDEMARLRQVNVSMGLMVEQTTPQLLETVHRHAPSKLPGLRLEQLDWAGQLRIPFTTGLLLGLGEIEDDWVEALGAIARLHARYGHIQEVILQPHSPGQRQAETGASFSPDQLIQAIHLARAHLPSDVTIQIPPNLVNAEQLRACLTAGARDLGGIGPMDEVNPDYPHPTAADLAIAIGSKWTLQPRLPVYPHHENWLGGQVRSRVAHWRQQLPVPSPII